jgi:predicted dehydrogenase
LSYYLGEKRILQHFNRKGDIKMKKCAIVGFGGQGKQWVIASNAVGTQIVAVCDANPAAIGKKLPTQESWAASFPPLAERKSLPKIYTSSQQLFWENPGLDVVIVATWTASHLSVIREALASGAKSIVCEEPMASSLADAKEIIRICEKANVLLAVHCVRRDWPAHVAVKNIIEKGVIGKLRSITISCGGCRIGILGVHWLDFVRFVADSEVESVTGYLGPVTEDEPRGPQFYDPPAQAFIAFENGIKAFIEQGADIALSPHYEIVGTKGRIFNDQLNLPIAKENWLIYALKKPHASPIRDYMGEMDLIELPASQEINWREMGIPPLQELLERRISYGGAEGYKTLEVLIAVHLSHHRGNIPVKFPIADEVDLNFHIKNA